MIFAKFILSKEALAYRKRILEYVSCGFWDMEYIIFD